MTAKKGAGRSVICSGNCRRNSPANFAAGRLIGYCWGIKDWRKTAVLVAFSTAAEYWSWAAKTLFATASRMYIKPL